MPGCDRIPVMLAAKITPGLDSRRLPHAQLDYA
jgi:hypothetical protein